MRTFAILILLAFLLLGAFATPSSAAVALRSPVVVQGPVIMLSDLFTGIATAADQRIGTAPAPGRRAFYSIADIAAVARGHGLGWRPPANIERIAVTRAADPVPEAEVVAALADALLRHGIEGEPRIELAAGTDRLYVPVGAAAAVSVESLSVDRRRHRFSALVRASAEDHAAPLVRVAGRLVPVHAVPVLRRGLQPGDIVGEDDIEWREIAASRLPRGGVMQAESMIGLSPRRPLRAGQILRRDDLREPLLVAKGGLVTMELQVPGLRLTARGRALQDGGEGDSVQILNLQSRRTVEAVVTGRERVSVLMQSAQPIGPAQSTR